MIKISSLLSGVALCILTMDVAHGTDGNGQFAIKGVGNASCTDYVRVVEENDPQKLLFAGWINGYITAHNQHLSETFDVTSWENIETIGNYLREHCKKNSELSFFQATTQLVNQLHPDRIKEFKGAENMSSGSQSIKSYIQVNQKVQTRLKTLGFYEGEIDGKMTPALIDGVNQFRATMEWPETLVLDQRTLHMLLREK